MPGAVWSPQQSRANSSSCILKSELAHSCLWCFPSPVGTSFCVKWWTAILACWQSYGLVLWLSWQKQLMLVGLSCWHCNNDLKEHLFCFECSESDPHSGSARERHCFLSHLFSFLLSHLFFWFCPRLVVSSSLWYHCVSFIKSLQVTFPWLDLFLLDCVSKFSSNDVSLSAKSHKLLFLLLSGIQQNFQLFDCFFNFAFVLFYFLAVVISAMCLPEPFLVRCFDLFY